MDSTVVFSESVDGVDWRALKAALAADHFDNGRTPEEYEASHRGSHAVAFAKDGDAYVGNARILSDGVCNAYLVDVWTATSHRRRGIGSELVRRLLARVPGQHVYLQTDDMQAFYRALGFRAQPAGMGRVVGSWLNRPGGEPSEAAAPPTAPASPPGTRAPSSGEPRDGITTEELATVDLAGEIEGMAGHRLRMRLVTMEPGAVFGPIHDHVGRPGVVYVLQGTITDHRDGVDTEYGPGVGWPEDRTTIHWLENRGPTRAFEISVDIVRQA